MEKWGIFDIIIDDFDPIINESIQLESLSNFPYGNQLMTQIRRQMCLGTYS